MYLQEKENKEKKHRRNLIKWYLLRKGAYYVRRNFIEQITHTVVKTNIHNIHNIHSPFCYELC